MVVPTVVAAAALMNRAWCRFLSDFHHLRAEVVAAAVVVEVVIQAV